MNTAPPPAQKSLAPGSRIGILGGGQLGRMLCLAAARLGFDTHILDPDPDAPAGRVTNAHTIAAFDDADAIARFAASVEVVTYEFENVPTETAGAVLAAGGVLRPGVRPLEVAQDRLIEKRFVRDSGVATVAFEAVDDGRDLKAALKSLGGPALLKTRRLGYDGKGQIWVDQTSDLERAFAGIGSAPAILEAKADFTRELSQIVARGVDGKLVYYPLTETHHKDGMLARAIAPAPHCEGLIGPARDIARRLAAGFNYVGVMAVELFDTPEGLLVNEIAPRVHNSGHWTDGFAQTDQFEQHIRCVAGWPLARTNAMMPCELINLIGNDAEDWARYAADPEARIHWYGKKDIRPGRKMGHLVRPLKSL